MRVSPSRFHWKFKPLATVDAAGVQNTWYTVLDTTSKARIYSIGSLQTNNEADAKSLTIRTTVDGVAQTSGNYSRASGSVTYWYLDPNMDRTLPSTPFFNAGYYVALHGKSVKVEVRSITAAGTNQHLYGYVRYAQLEAL